MSSVATTERASLGSPRQPGQTGHLSKPAWLWAGAAPAHTGTRAQQLFCGTRGEHSCWKARPVPRSTALSTPKGKKTKERQGRNVGKKLSWTKKIKICLVLSLFTLLVISTPLNIWVVGFSVSELQKSMESSYLQ